MYVSIYLYIYIYHEFGLKMFEGSIYKCIDHTPPKMCLSKFKCLRSWMDIPSGIFKGLYIQP